MSGPVSAAPAPEAAVPPPAAAEATVTIVGPFQTSHAGQVYGPGDTVTVPAATARAWELNGWAVPAE